MVDLKGFIKSQLLEIIQWQDDSRDTVSWLFPDEDKEIKNGAQLIVRESQVAVFVDQGRVADVFVPGRYTLNTDNLPILTTLRGWKFGFESAYKAEVYFVNTRTFTDQKWGTKNPIMRLKSLYLRLCVPDHESPNRRPYDLHSRVGSTRCVGCMYREPLSNRSSLQVETRRKCVIHRAAEPQTR